MEYGGVVVWDFCEVTNLWVSWIERLKNERMDFTAKVLRLFKI
jgi:hypothetical protein